MIFVFKMSLDRFVFGCR